MSTDKAVIRILESSWRVRAAVIPPTNRRQKMVRGIFLRGMLGGRIIASMTVARPEENKRQACDQSGANRPEKPVHRSGERSSAKNKQSEGGAKDNPRDDSPDHDRHRNKNK